MLVQLYHSQLQQVLDRFYDIGAKPSVMLHGTFGIGKTYAMRDFAMRKAKELGLEYSEDFNDVNDESKFLLLPFILHQYEPGEIKGLPFPSEDRSKTIYLPIGLLPVKGQGVIFFDEIPLAAPMMQNNAYQLIEDRKLGFYKVPKGFIVHGAGNKDDDRAHNFEMAMPLNNRMLHAELLVPTVTDITDADGNAIKGWVNAYALPNGVDHRVINFLNTHTKYLFTYDPEKEDQDVTQATPRMWQKVSDLIKGIPDTNTTAIKTFVGMGVGTGIATEFVAWLRLTEKYDIASIFRTGKLDKPARVDVLFSLISALVGYYMEKLKDKAVDQKKMALRLMELSQVFNKEHTVMLLNQAKSMDKDFFPKIREIAPDKFSALADKLFNLLI